MAKVGLAKVGFDLFEHLQETRRDNKSLPHNTCTATCPGVEPAPWTFENMLLEMSKNKIGLATILRTLR